MKKILICLLILLQVTTFALGEEIVFPLEEVQTEGVGGAAEEEPAEVIGEMLEAPSEPTALPDVPAEDEPMSGEEEPAPLLPRGMSSEAELLCDRTLLAVGETVQASFAGDNIPTKPAVRWVSDNRAIATVSGKGRIKAVRVGEATITATAGNGVTASVTIQVVPAPTAVSFGLDRTELAVGETIFIQSPTMNNGNVGTYTIVSGKPKILTVSPDGRVTAVSKGRTHVTMKAYNGRYCRIYVTVKPVPTRVSFSKPEITMTVGEALTGLAATDTAGEITYTFESGAEHAELRQHLTQTRYDAKTGAFIETEIGNALVALSEGTVQLTATTFNGLQARCTINIVPETIGMQWIPPERMTYGVGESLRLNVALEPSTSPKESVQYYALDKNAVVDASGVVTFKRAGKASLIAVHEGLKKIERIGFTVVKAPSSVKLVSSMGNTLSVGQQTDISVTLNNGNIGPYSFVGSSNTKVLTVDAEGRVTAVGAGKAAVSVKAYNGKVGKLTLNVKQPPTALSIARDAVTLASGEGIANAATANAPTTITYNSSDTDIAAVDAQGTITGVSPGEATVTAKTHNGLTATTRVRVTSALEAIGFEPGGLTLAKGDTVFLQPNYTPSDCMNPQITITSLNPRVVKLQPDNTLKAVAVGTTSILVRSVYHAEITAELPVSVVKAPSSIVLSTRSTILCVGQRERLNATLNNGGYGSIRYTSSAPAVLEIDENGTMLARSGGTAVITAKTFNGKTARMTFTVIAAPKAPSIKLPFDDDCIRIGVSDRYTLVTEAECPLTFTSSDPSVAVVDADTGAITAMSAGATTITAATYEGGPKTSCTVRVYDAWSEFKLPNVTEAPGGYSKMLNKGSALTLAPYNAELNVAGFTVTADNPAQQCIALNGNKITGKKPGETALTITMFDGQVIRLAILVI